MSETNIMGFTRPAAPYGCWSCDFPLATHGLQCQFCVDVLPDFRERYMELEMEAGRVLEEYERKGLDVRAATASVREGLLELTPGVEFFVNY